MTTRIVEVAAAGLPAYLSTLANPLRRAHLEVAVSLGWGSSTAVGEWWSNGFLALRLFPGANAAERLELSCECGGQYPLSEDSSLTYDREKPIPACCAWVQGTFGGTEPDCQAETPLECLHTEVWWDGPKEPFTRLTDHLQRCAAQDQHHLTVEAESRVDEYGLTFQRAVSADGLWFGLSQDAVHVIEGLMAPDAWGWIGAPNYPRRERRGQGAIRGLPTPMAVALRAGEPVAYLMPIYTGEGVWQSAEETVAV